MIWNPLGWPKWAQGALALALAALAVVLWFRAHDSAVIDNHEAGITEQVTTATNAANDVANTNDAVRRENDARADEQLREVIKDAEEKHPVEVRHDAGPATAAVMRRLRDRSTAPGPAASK